MIGRADPVSWAERGYSLLLHVYPRQYRSRFARAMCDTFLCDHARARAAGPGALAPFWIVTIAHRPSGSAPASAYALQYEVLCTWLLASPSLVFTGRS